jgi:hypothetical protein
MNLFYVVLGAVWMAGAVFIWRWTHSPLSIGVYVLFFCGFLYSEFRARGLF